MCLQPLIVVTTLTTFASQNPAIYESLTSSYAIVQILLELKSILFLFDIIYRIRSTKRVGTRPAMFLIYKHMFYCVSLILNTPANINTRVFYLHTNPHTPVGLELNHALPKFIHKIVVYTPGKLLHLESTRLSIKQKHRKTSVTFGWFASCLTSIDCVIGLSIRQTYAFCESSGPPPPSLSPYIHVSHYLYVLYLLENSSFIDLYTVF